MAQRNYKEWKYIKDHFHDYDIIVHSNGDVTGVNRKDFIQDEVYFIERFEISYWELGYSDDVKESVMLWLDKQIIKATVSLL